MSQGDTMKYRTKVLFSVLLLLICVSASFSQVSYTRYYGKNRVMYTDFDWETYTTPHFNIYSYAHDAEVMKKVADLAESAYESVSRKIKHQLSSRVPLIYYRTFTDFEQSNLFRPPEGALGVSEPLLYRVAVMGDMPIDDLYELFLHEMSHIFQYDLLYGTPGGVVYALSRPPDWVFEGFSEYCTENWTSWSELAVRDAVLNDRIPDMTGFGALYTQYPSFRSPSYDFGHAIYDYIEHRYGKNGVRNFWQSLKGVPRMARTNFIQRAFNQDFQQFSFEYKKYLREKYRPFLMRENPEEYSISMGPQYPRNQYIFAFSHTVSPSGDMVATVTLNTRDLDLDVIVFSSEDGHMINNLTKGYTLKYTSIKFEVDPSNGRAVAWSPDGDRIAFFGRTGHKHSLFLVDALSGNIAKTAQIPQDQPTSPVFSPDSRELLFTAFDNGIRDIFKMNLETDEIINLTTDDLYEKGINISPDGTLVAYSIRLHGQDKLFISPFDNLDKKTQLTFGKGNTITPSFSIDAQEIFFSGDMRDAYNIYSVSLETGEIKQYTDVRTGNFLPVQDPNEPEKIIFSSFNKGSIQVYKSALEGEVIKAITPKDLVASDQHETFKPTLSLELDQTKIQRYGGLGQLYMVGRPPISAMVSTDGSIYGGTSLAFADIFHDHIFSLTAYQVRNFRNYSLAYLNQKNRFQFMASAFTYTFFYYPAYSYYDPSLAYLLSYKDAIATRNITGIQVQGYYPLSMYCRIEVGTGYTFYEEDFYDPYINQLLALGGSTYGYFWNGSNIAVSAALVGETTRFKYYGPAKGNTFRVAIAQSLPISDAFISNTSLDLDYRQYLYLGGDALFAFRFNGWLNRGKNAYVTYYGGNNEVRSTNFYSLVATEGWYANLEFRIPVINMAYTLLGALGPVRGSGFFDVTRSRLGNNPWGWGVYVPDLDEPFQWFDALGSYGLGIEVFFMGFPMHVDFIWGLGWQDLSSPFDYTSRGYFGTKFWIGLDF